MEARTPIARWIFWTACAIFVGFLLVFLRGVLTPVLFAFLLAYMLNPVVSRFESWRIPRTGGIVILLTIVLMIIGAFILLVLPSIISDVWVLFQKLPVALQRLLVLVEPWLRERGIEIPGTASEILERFKGDLSVFAGGGLSSLSNVIDTVLGSTASLFAVVAAAIMVPVFCFYLLMDFERIIRTVRDLLPHDMRSTIIEITNEVDQVLGQFLRGQVTVMAILTVLYAIAYSAVGVPLAVPIAVIAGLLSFIPYVGGATALGLAILMMGLHWTGWIQLLSVIAAYALIQLLEGFIITPRIVGEKLGLAPIWVLFALMVGGELFGFMGVMLALPASAVIKVFVVRGIVSYKKSSFYRGDTIEQSDEEEPIHLPVLVPEANINEAQLPSTYSGEDE